MMKRNRNAPPEKILPGIFAIHFFPPPIFPYPICPLPKPPMPQCPLPRFHSPLRPDPQLPSAIPFAQNFPLVSRRTPAARRKPFICKVLGGYR